MRTIAIGLSLALTAGIIIAQPPSRSDPELISKRNAIEKQLESLAI